MKELANSIVSDSGRCCWERLAYVAIVVEKDDYAERWPRKIHLSAAKQTDRPVPIAMLGAGGKGGKMSFAHRAARLLKFTHLSDSLAPDELYMYACGTAAAAGI